MNEPGNRVVVITGAAPGIGHATTELFRDLGDKAAVDAAIEACRARPHRRLANIAGIVQFGRVETVTEEEWDRVHAVDLEAALPHIRACGGTIVKVSSVAGNVAQPYATAYAAATGGLTRLTRALALGLSPEGIRVNAICPGTVDTPFVEQVFHKITDDLDARVADRLMMMLPGGAITPPEIGETVVWLASPAARMVTGAVIAHDGGMS